MAETIGSLLLESLAPFFLLCFSTFAFQPAFTTASFCLFPSFVLSDP